MDRMNTIDLLSASYTQDEIGQQIPTYTRRTIYCEIRSIQASEFFQAGRAGLKPACKALIFAPDYNGEELAELEGALYRIYRNYSPTPDHMELYLEKKAGG